VEKRGNNTRKTVKIGICTPLKYKIYFLFVSIGSFATIGPPKESIWSVIRHLKSDIL